MTSKIERVGERILRGLFWIWDAVLVAGLAFVLYVIVLAIREAFRQ